MNRRNFLLAAASVSVAVPGSGCKGAHAETGPLRRTPVLVELFTSEGCSSCPPADTLLQQLHSTQPVAGVEIVPLELHVDYWDDLGWKDPFSASEFSRRQRVYQRARGGSSAFTPEAVIGGRRSVLGSSRPRLLAAIEAARSEVTTPVVITTAGDRVQVKVAEPVELANADLQLWMAVTEGELRTSVPSGENAGRTVEHAPVVRKLNRIGPVSKGTIETHINPSSDWKRTNLRIVVFVQDGKTRLIHGTASIGFA